MYNYSYDSTERQQIQTMTTASSPSTLSSLSSVQPWIYFLSGALLPTISYFFLLRSKKKDDDDSDDDEDDDDDSEDESQDEDLFGVETSGPSSKWNITDAPYKVSVYFL